MMHYFAQFNKQQWQWRVLADYRAIGGEIMDICAALNSTVAYETAAALNEARK